MAVPCAPMQETLPPTQQVITAPKSHYNGFPFNNQWGISKMVCVRSFSGVGIIDPAPLLLSQRKSLWGPGMAVPPPVVSTVENN